MPDQIRIYHVDDPNDAPERRLSAYPTINPFIPTSLPTYVIPPVANSLYTLMQYQWYTAYQQGIAAQKQQQEQLQQQQQHQQQQQQQQQQHQQQQQQQQQQQHHQQQQHLHHHQQHQQLQLQHQLSIHQQNQHLQAASHQQNSQIDTGASTATSTITTLTSTSSQRETTNSPVSSTTSADSSSSIASTSSASSLNQHKQRHNHSQHHHHNHHHNHHHSSQHHNQPQPNQQQQLQQHQPSQQQNGKPHVHIKKPLNPFMIYMQKRRPEIVKQGIIKESAAINQMLGQQWRKLSKEEQEPYYKLAEQEKILHAQKYPGWSARDNYANQKKKKKLKLKSISMNGLDQSDKKCRARFGLTNMGSWCKPCRRKKRCIYSTPSIDAHRQ